MHDWREGEECMITPEVFLNLDTGILNFSRAVIEIFLKSGESRIKYDELRKGLENYFSKREIEYMYILTLDFLFLLGKVEYSVEHDEVELIR